MKRRETIPDNALRRFCCPWFDKLTMRFKPLKDQRRSLILVTSKPPHWPGLVLMRARRRDRLILGRRSPQLSMGPPPHIH